MKLLDQLELAGFIKARLADDGTITVTIQAGVADPRPALEAARKLDGRGTRLGSVQRTVVALLKRAGDPSSIQAIYDDATPLLPIPLGRDTRAQQIKRAMEKLSERGVIVVHDDLVKLTNT